MTSSSYTSSTSTDQKSQNYQIAVDTKLIGGKETGGLISANFKVMKHAIDEKGNSVVFALTYPTDKINGDLYYIAPDEKSETGWICSDTGIKASSLHTIESDNDKRISRVFTSSADKIHQNFNLFEVINNQDGSFEKRVISTLPFKEMSNTCPESRLDGNTLNGEIILIHTCNTPSLHVINIEQNEVRVIKTGHKFGSSPFLAKLVKRGIWPKISLIFGGPCVVPEGVSSGVVFIGSSSSQSPNCNIKTLEGTYTSFALASPHTPKGVISSDMVLNDFETRSADDGLLEIFAVGSGGEGLSTNIVILRQTSGGLTASNPPIFEKSSTFIHGQVIDNGIESLHSIKLREKGNGEFELFVGGTQIQNNSSEDVIFYCEQNVQDHDKWSSLLPLTSGGNYCAGENSDGLSELFVEDTTASKGLARLNQEEIKGSTNSSSASWTRTMIYDKPPLKENIRDQSLYRTCFTVTDQEGNPQSNQTFSLSASTLMEARVRGEVMQLNPDSTQTLQTNALGQIGIEYFIDDTLYCPHLIFKSNNILGAKQLIVHPDAAIHQSLAKVTPKDLEKKSGVTQVVPDKYQTPADLNHLSQTLQKTANMAQALCKPKLTEYPLFVKDMDFAGIHLLDGKNVGDHGALFDLDMTPWKFGMETGRPVYQTLDMKTFSLLKNKAEQNRLKLGGIFDDIGDFFGDVVETVKSVAGKVVDFMISGTKAVITFVLDGVSFVIDAVISNLREVFNVVDLIFDQIGTIMAKVVLWVLDLFGFLYDWKQILSLKETIKSKTRNQIKASNEKISSTLTNIDDWVHKIDSFPNILSKINTSVKKEPDFADKGFDNLVPVKNIRSSLFIVGEVNTFASGTMMFDRLMDEVVNTVMPSPPKMPNLQLAIDDLIKQGDQFEGQAKEVAQTVVSTFESYFNSDKNWADLTIEAAFTVMSQAMETLQKAATMGITFGVSFLKAVYGAIQDITGWLETEIYIPFFSAFYKTLTSSELTLLDIMCLIVAIPSYGIIKVTNLTADILSTDKVESEQSSSSTLNIVSAVALYLGSAFTFGSDLAGRGDGGKELSGIFTVLGSIGFIISAAVVFNPGEDFNSYLDYGSLSSLLAIGFSVYFLYNRNNNSVAQKKYNKFLEGIQAVLTMFFAVASFITTIILMLKKDKVDPKDILEYAMSIIGGIADFATTGYEEVNDSPSGQYYIGKGFIYLGLIPGLYVAAIAVE